MNRADEIAGFLDQAGWRDATAEPLTGDASTRRYCRYRRASDTAMLMDADPRHGTPTGPFVAVAQHLSGLGLAAPQILAWDQARGLMLLEDFGDDLIARVITDRPETEPALYGAAVDVLVALHRHPPPGEFPVYDHTEMGQRAALSMIWYRPGAEGRLPEADDHAQASALASLVTTCLEVGAPGYPVLALRDYHAENLIWRPERSALDRIGLLDFQDAMACHPAYDLISLLEDVRRDVPRDLAQDMRARYIAATRADPRDFDRACAICAAQRNLRILGVFSRLSLHYGKPHYVDLLPRTWAHLMRDLQHPDLTELRERVTRMLPPPSPEVQTNLRKGSGTWPMQ